MNAVLQYKENITIGLNVHKVFFCTVIAVSKNFETSGFQNVYILYIRGSSYYYSAWNDLIDLNFSLMLWNNFMITCFDKHKCRIEVN